MGVELSILGIRKIKDEEIKELTGKTRNEMEKCKFFRNFFPHAPYHSWYWTYSHKEISMDESYKSVIHMFSPVEDANGVIVYVIWVEKLGNYRHKDPYGRGKIELFWKDVHDVDWKQAFHVVPYGDISDYTDWGPSVRNTRKELVAFIYG